MTRLYLILIIALLTAGSGNAQISNKKSPGSTSKGLFGLSFRKNGSKVKNPVSAKKSIKKQEAKDKKLKRDYNKFIKKSQKRTYEIQTPDVKARMKQNQKDNAIRDKTKKKKTRSSTKKAGKKYK